MSIKGAASGLVPYGALESPRRCAECTSPSLAANLRACLLYSHTSYFFSLGHHQFRLAISTPPRFGLPQSRPYLGALICASLAVLASPCSAPPESSHQVGLVRSELARAPVAQRLMRSLVVVPAGPAGDDISSLVEALEAMLPGCLPLRRLSEEAATFKGP
jgi:hypothetical protein